MSNFTGIACVECHAKEPVDSPSQVCKRCGGRLGVVMDLEAAKETVTRESIGTSKERGVWKYRELLPLVNPREIVSLGEGNTNLMRSESLAEILGMRRLFIKDETSSPSGSFLDRGTTVEVSRVKALGYGTIACGWSGNLASSMAAYSARGGLRSRAYLPSQIDLGKLYQIVAYGAEIIPCASREEAMRSVSEHEEEHYPLTPRNAFFLEGIKTSGIEILDQMNWRQPDWIVVPMGNGSHVSMIYKGLKDLETLGVIDRPRVRLLGVQAEGCSPIVDMIKGTSGRSKHGGADFVRDIAVEDPAMAKEAMAAIGSSEGDALVVTEKEILDAVKSLASHEGVFAEPASASTIAAVRKALESRIIGRSESVVCMITGMGLKDPSMARRLASKDRTARSIITRYEAAPITRRIGDTKLAILAMLRENESYAYSLRRELALKGRSISLVSVYQHLTELEEMGLVAVERQERTAEGRRRVYYAMTAKGREALSSLGGGPVGNRLL